MRTDSNINEKHAETRQAENDNNNDYKQFNSQETKQGRPRSRFRFFIHQVLQQGKCLESGKHTNISKQQH